MSHQVIFICYYFFTWNSKNDGTTNRRSNANSFIIYSRSNSFINNWKKKTILRSYSFMSLSHAPLTIYLLWGLRCTTSVIQFAVYSDSTDVCVSSIAKAAMSRMYYEQSTHTVFYLLWALFRVIALEYTYTEVTCAEIGIWAIS